MALDRGFDVIGRDVNPKCVDGTVSNLRHLVGDDFRHRWQIDTCDSGLGNTAIEREVDCVVSNLPWGLNSVQYIDDNRRILTQVRELIRPGIPCAFIAKADLPFLADVGYEAIEKAFVPPANFDLPSGEKKRKTTSSDARAGRERRNSCVVFVARAV